MKNNIKNKLIHHTSKKKVKTSNNQEFRQINSDKILKSWKKEEKRGKNMAVFESLKLYIPVIPTKYISKIKNKKTIASKNKLKIHYN